MVAVLFPVAEGSKVTVKVWFAPAAIVEGKVGNPLNVKSVASTPVIVIVFTVKSAVPVF